MENRGLAPRFSILVCIDGSDASYEGLHIASKLGKTPECDIILIYVRQVDQGLRTGGLQARVARENMMEWGIELPGIEYLQHGLEILTEDGIETKEWIIEASHRDVWGDPLGDNKVEYRHEDGRSIVLKLKTSPDEAGGILDQYELGPYNLIIMGEPGRWRGGLRSNINAGVAQKVAMLAPCSVLIARRLSCGPGLGAPAAYSLQGAPGHCAVDHHANVLRQTRVKQQGRIVFGDAGGGAPAHNRRVRRFHGRWSSSRQF